MEIINKNGYLTLKAAEGKYLTQKVLSETDSKLFVVEITVDENTKDNYIEITEEEKLAYEENALNTPLEAKAMAMPIPDIPIKEEPKETPKEKRENKIDELRKDLERILRRIEKKEKAQKKLMKAIIIGIGIMIVGIITLIII
jgi:hypothetical protein